MASMEKQQEAQAEGEEEEKKDGDQPVQLIPGERLAHARGNKKLPKRDSLIEY